MQCIDGVLYCRSGTVDSLHDNELIIRKIYIFKVESFKFDTYNKD